MPRALPSHTRRLAELVNRPGGITADEAVRAAEARLNTIRDAGLTELGQMVEHMQAAGGALARSPSLSVCDELYAVSNSLVGVAGVFGLPELGEVAFSLCTLLDRQRRSGSWDGETVYLHVNSAKLMLSSDADQAARRAVISALQQVVSRLYGPAL